MEVPVWCLLLVFFIGLFLGSRETSGSLKQTATNENVVLLQTPRRNTAGTQEKKEPTRNIVEANNADEQVIPFYLYNSEEFNRSVCRAPEEYTNEELPRIAYWCVGREWLRQAKAHPWRVLDPHKAKVFIVAFDVCDSFATRGKCEGMLHVNRVDSVFEYLKASPWFQKSGGRDHFWAIMHITLPPAMIGKKKWSTGNIKHAFFPNYPQNDLIRNMSIGRYVSYHLTLNDKRFGFKPQQRDWLREEEKWGCTIVLPVISPRSVWVDDQDTSFEAWQQRSTFLYFRGNGGYGGGCFMKNGEQARKVAVDFGKKNISFPKPSILTNSHASSPTGYYEEIKNAQYCLVFACDDPQTSRFFDALAAGCIPVVINDAWRVAVAPFASRVNYDSFVITIPESAWMRDPATAAHLIYNHPPGVQRRRYNAMLSERQYLSWRHPKPNVVQRVIQEVYDCSLEK
eukprot:m.147006 g.147006  ORF g.147006 m.147006 type:complete len:455 (-) comp14980_c0_seq1:3233-4597(-)